MSSITSPINTGLEPEMKTVQPTDQLCASVIPLISDGLIEIIFNQSQSLIESPYHTHAEMLEIFASEHMQRYSDGFISDVAILLTASRKISDYLFLSDIDIEAL